MSVIQRIRDKYAKWAVVAIALSLLGFIMMDAFAGRTGLFGGDSQSTTIGKVNGTSIERLDFDKKTKDQEAMLTQRGYTINEENRYQVVDQVWNEEVGQILLSKEYEKLGLTITDRELRDMMYGANPAQWIQQYFTDPKTGKVDVGMAQQQITALQKTGTVEQKTVIANQIELSKKQRLLTKYMTMLANTVYFPKWFLEKKNIDNSLLARASFVTIPYASIPDSTVKITDDEIRKYMNENPDQFEQKEETRSISYLAFSASPNGSDSVAARTSLEELKPQFEAATDIKTFLARQGSTIPFFDGFVSKTAIQVPAKDTILKLAKGAVYGPYLDGNSYVLAKMIDDRTLPDSVKVRHILLGTMSRDGQPLYPDSLAKAKADSIEAAIKGGANFDTLETRYSTDESAHQTKGVMTFSSTDIQGDNFAKEFGQFILFDGKTGDKKVVKTAFGYHFIEILEQKNIQPHYKVAYFSKPIIASDNTDADASSLATSFAGDSRDVNSFNQNAEKLRAKGVNRFTATDLTPMSFNIQSLQGNARSLVKNVFEADKGDVLDPQRVGENYVVAVVTEVNKPGTIGVAAGRLMVEPVLRKKKQGEQIIAKIGQITSLEQASTKMGQPVQSLDSLRLTGGTLGYEPKVIGAIFNPANKNKVIPQPIAGSQGVYAIRVDNVSTTPVAAGTIEEQQRMYEGQSKQGLMSQMQQGTNPYVEALKKAAKIKDNRPNFY